MIMFAPVLFRGHCRRPTAALVLAALALLLVSGCTPKPQPPSRFDEWKARVDRSQPLVPRKQAVTLDEGALAAGTQTGAGTEAAEEEDLPPLPSQPISVRFVNDDLASVLRGLGRMAGQNIIINPDVQGTVNAHIENTPWDAVFTGLIDSYGLVLRREAGLLRVMTVADMEKEVARDKLTKAKNQVAPLVTRVFPIQFADPEQIAATLSPMLSKDDNGKERGSLTVDKHSRSLVIADTAERLAEFTRLINELDRSTPQILIQAHIVETSQDTARELGVQWGGFWQEQLTNDRGIAFTPGGINGTVDEQTGKITYNAGAAGLNRTGISTQGFAVDLPAQAIGNFQPAAFGFLHFNASGDVLEIQLSALEKAGKINIVSEPSIVTLDNNEAIIESGRDIPYQTIEDNSVKIEYKEASLKLTVTPHVIGSGTLKLDIHAKKDEVDFNNAVAGNPTIIKKQAHTQLLVADGDTVVIAGLSKERDTTGDTGVPGLKDLPLLGRLFRNDSRSSQFEEVLVFITPRILGEKPLAAATAKP